MKKLLVAAVLVAGIAGVAVWQVLPVYVENQFRQSLDAWVASRPNEGSAYSDASLDYWADQARIGSITDVLTIAVGDEAVTLIVTMQDVVIDGYDLSAVGRVTAGVSPDGEKLAHRIAWSSTEIFDAEGKVRIAGGEGAVVGLWASSLDPGNLTDLGGVFFDRYQQSPATLTLENGGAQLNATLGDVSVTGYSRSGFSDLSVGKFRVSAAAEAEGAFATGWDGLAATGLTRGEPTVLSNLFIQKFFMEFDVPAEVELRPQLSPEQPPLKTRKFEGRLSYGAYELREIRFDESLFGLYRDVIALLSGSDGSENEAEVVRMVEDGLTLLERAEAQATGFGSMSVDDLDFDFADIQVVSIGHMSGAGASGLRLGRIEMLDQRQTDEFGNVIEVDSTVVTDVDLSALPAYLRKVLGTPVSADSLNRAEAFYRENTIAAAIPALDLGKWETLGQTITTPDNLSILLERATQEGFRADENGNVFLAFSIEGLKIDSRAGAALGPDAQALFPIAGAYRFEELNLDFGIDLMFSPADGRFVIRNLNVAEQTFAALELAADISGVDVEQMRDLPPDARASVLMSAAVNKVTATLVDSGGRAFLFTALDQDSGLSQAEAAAVLSDQIVAALRDLGSTRADNVSEAVTAFVTSGGMLHLSAVPEAPLPVVHMLLLAQGEGPGAVFDALQITAEHRVPD